MVPVTHVQHRPALLKILNKQAILRVIHEHDGISRAQISKICRISKPTASMAVAELLSRKLIMETGKYSESVGRKGEKLTMNTNINTAWTLGIVVGVKETKVICGNLKGAILEYTSAFKMPPTYEAFIEHLFVACDAVLRNFGVLPMGCGISMPGMCDDDTGEIFHCPNIHMLEGRNVAREVEGHYGIKTVQIQEVRAICLSAILYENTDKFRNIFCINLGEGLGGAVVFNGELYQGTHHAGGEIGHIPLAGHSRQCGCGQKGCIETVIALPWLLQTWKERHGSSDAIDNFFDVCKKYPGQAKEIFYEALPQLVHVLLATVQIFDPEAILVTGTVWNLIPSAIDKLKSYLPERIEVVAAPATSFAQGAFASVFNRIIIQSLAVPFEEGTV